MQADDAGSLRARVESQHVGLPPTREGMILGDMCQAVGVVCEMLSQRGFHLRSVFGFPLRRKTPARADAAGAFPPRLTSSANPEVMDALNFLREAFGTRQFERTDRNKQLRGAAAVSEFSTSLRPVVLGTCTQRDVLPNTSMHAHLWFGVPCASCGPEARARRSGSRDVVHVAVAFVVEAPATVSTSLIADLQTRVLFAIEASLEEGLAPSARGAKRRAQIDHVVLIADKKPPHQAKTRASFRGVDSKTGMRKGAPIHPAWRKEVERHRGPLAREHEEGEREGGGESGAGTAFESEEEPKRHPARIDVFVAKEQLLQNPLRHDDNPELEVLCSSRAHDLVLGESAPSSARLSEIAKIRPWDVVARFLGLEEGMIVKERHRLELRTVPSEAWCMEEHRAAKEAEVIAATSHAP